MAYQLGIGQPLRTLQRSRNGGQNGPQSARRREVLDDHILVYTFISLKLLVGCDEECILTTSRRITTDPNKTAFFGTEKHRKAQKSTESTETSIFFSFFLF